MVSREEEERRQELLSTYGSRIYSGGGTNYRSLALGETNEIKYSTSNKVDKDVMISKNMPFLSTIQEDNTEKGNPIKKIEFLQIGQKDSNFRRKSKIFNKSSFIQKKVESDVEKINKNLQISRGNRQNIKMRK
mmetsp:Transcript_41530/g.47912  ORF Transcript_41530/g.47912 Transcript_41530/m.47912 type:complete len:133 (-) Transcript_41530:265-663(-)